MSDQELLAKLQAENARLISLLDARGIEWRPSASVLPASEPSKLSTGDKVALFRHLFRGRADIYPIRGDGDTRSNNPTIESPYRKAEFPTILGLQEMAFLLEPPSRADDAYHARDPGR